MLRTASERGPLGCKGTGGKEQKVALESRGRKVVRGAAQRYGV